MNKTIKFVRNFLYQHCNQTGPSTVAALFSMESLFANKSMVYETLQYEADLMILSIELFNENDFAIKYDLNMFFKYYLLVYLNVLLLF